MPKKPNDFTGILVTKCYKVLASATKTLRLQATEIVPNPHKHQLLLVRISHKVLREIALRRF